MIPLSIGKAEAIQSLKPEAEWVLHGDVLTWMDEVQTEPTQSEIDAEIIVLQAEYDQLNQFEMIFDDDRDGTTTWVDTINEIKGRHPK